MTYTFAIRALVKFNVSNNSLCAAGAKTLAEALKGNQIMSEINLSNNSLGKVGPGSAASADMSGVIAISDAIPTMGALVKLVMGDNKLKGAEAGKALGDAIAVNTVLKELDLSSPESYNSDKSDAEFAKAFSVGLGCNGAMRNLNISSNRLTAEGAESLAEALKAQQQLVCDDGTPFQSKSVLARSTCKHCEKKKGAHATRGTLTSVDASDNALTDKGKKALQQAAGSR